MHAAQVAIEANELHPPPHALLIIITLICSSVLATWRFLMKSGSMLAVDLPTVDEKFAVQAWIALMSSVATVDTSQRIRRRQSIIVDAGGRTGTARTSPLPCAGWGLAWFDSLPQAERGYVRSASVNHASSWEWISSLKRSASFSNSTVAVKVTLPMIAGSRYNQRVVCVHLAGGSWGVSSFRKVESGTLITVARGDE